MGFLFLAILIAIVELLEAPTFVALLLLVLIETGVLIWQWVRRRRLAATHVTIPRDQYALLIAAVKIVAGAELWRDRCPDANSDTAFAPAVTADEVRSARFALQQANVADGIRVEGTGVGG